LQPVNILGDIWSDIGINNLHNEGGVDFKNGKKPLKLLERLLSIVELNKGDIVLDFFAGSASTAHAVMQLNAEDDGKRKFVMVQIPETCDEKSEAFITGYKTIAEISKERIRRAGKKIKEENPSAGDLDIGFRVLKVDSSNMNEVHYTPDTVSKSDLFNQVEHIKNDRSGEDLLFQVMLDWGVDLSLPIRAESIAGKTVYFVNDDDLVACFEEDIDEALIKALADYEPLRIVFRDDGFISDSVKINAEQIFKQLSPNSDIKVI
jgi:adenine-specific DNA-methyltransferase